MSREDLRRVFKTLSDPTRLRILALLAREELAVQDLMEILGMAQSRVSRHLAILREAGLLRDRRDGTFVHYRLGEPLPPLYREAWALARRDLERDPLCERDRAALEAVVTARTHRARDFFESLGPEWDTLRKVFDDDVHRARALANLLPEGLRVADVGTGTGILAAELARLGCRVVAVDASPRMLEAARARLTAEGLSGVALLEADAGSLPLATGSLDAAVAHMVLHYLPRPEAAVREMARAVRPGGRVVLVDFLAHDLDWMREELGVVWLGFEEGDVRGWLEGAELGDLRVECTPPRARQRELPGTFIASGRRRSG